MQAITHDRYGSADVLRLTDVEKPALTDDSVLVRVRAASVNAFDWHMMRGHPYLVRIDGGWRKPRQTRAGVDLAGTVEAVGRNVSEFRPGDDVFGESGGAFAEYVDARARSLAHKPANLTFEEASAVPMAGFTALQALRDKGQVRPGQRVLINGAAGGVGTFAVQIAKALGANVTGVCGAGHVETARAIGADEVIDYSQADFTRSGEVFDLIIDVAGSRSLLACRRVLRPEGALVVVGGPAGRWLGPLIGMISAAVLTRFVPQRLIPFVAKRSKDDLVTLGELIEAGKISPVIDRVYPLAQAAEAIRYVEQGHAGGKVVIAI